MSDDYGERIRIKRVDAGLTLGEMANKLGVGVACVCIREKESMPFAVRMLKAYCRIFNCSADELLGLNGYEAAPVQTRRYVDRKNIGKVALEVLRETGNNSIRRGDLTLLHMIADRIGVEQNGPKTADFILKTLQRYPGPLIKRKVVAHSRIICELAIPDEGLEIG